MAKIWITPTNSWESRCVHLEGKTASDTLFKFTMKFKMWILTQILKEISSTSGGSGMCNKTTSCISMFRVISDELCVMCDGLCVEFELVES